MGREEDSEYVGPEGWVWAASIETGRGSVVDEGESLTFPICGSKESESGSVNAVVTWGVRFRFAELVGLACSEVPGAVRLDALMVGLAPISGGDPGSDMRVGSVGTSAAASESRAGVRSSLPSSFVLFVMGALAGKTPPNVLSLLD